MLLCRFFTSKTPHSQTVLLDSRTFHFQNFGKMSSNQTMKAVLLKEFGGVDKMYIGECERPIIKSDELLVRVKATALNRADLLQRQGYYPSPPGDSQTMGLELAGIVEEVGSAVSSQWNKGDRVFGLVGGGGYATYCSIPSSMAIKIPDDLDFVNAVAIPEAFLTAFQALKWHGDLSDGKTVLIHAAASGVGLAAIQLTKQFKNTKVIVTAGSKEKLDFCASIGADFGINYKETPNFSAKVQEVTGGKGVDILLDFVGGSYWFENLKSMGLDSVLVLLGSLGGSNTEAGSIAPILQKRIHVKGTTLRTRSLEYKSKLTKEMTEFTLERFKDGRLKPIVDKIFNWNQVADAHTYMHENKNIGKIVMEID